MGERWSKERVWEWYNSRPWLRGCNYMSADCANRIDQWQELGFEERFKTTEEEFKLLKETGFNTIRIIPEFLVWNEQHDGFMERFDRYLSLAAKYGIYCMVVLCNDCMRPKSIENSKIGPQTVDLGYHGGRKLSQHGNLDEMGFHVLDEPETRERYLQMVKELVETYKNDERVLIWDVYNEPGNSKREEVTVPNLKLLFDIVRKINPIQPLTCGIWSTSGEPLEKQPETGKIALENSDVISYHNYSSYLDNVKIIKQLKRLGRPIINTEWLARCTNNNVWEMFPLFYLEKIGCYNWGFVVGKNQTNEPWNSIWDIYANNPSIDFDFTKWFHDLYRANHRPYDPKEIDFIKKICDLADSGFAEEGEFGSEK